MDDERNDEPGREVSDSPKKPYERPRILYREPLEAMAAICGPPGGKTAAMPICTTQGPINS